VVYEQEEKKILKIINFYQTHFCSFSIPEIKILYSYQTPYFTQKLFPGVEIEKNYF